MIFHAQPINQPIKQISKKRLEQGREDGVIGFRQASCGYMTEPYRANISEASDALMFDCNCRMTLVTCRTHRSGKDGPVFVLAELNPTPGEF